MIINEYKHFIQKVSSFRSFDAIITRWRACRLMDVEWLLEGLIRDIVFSTVLRAFKRRVRPRTSNVALAFFAVPPQLRIPHQLVSVPLGFNVTLECFTEAYPTSLNYWSRDDTQMLHDSKKYKSEYEVGTPSFKTHMKLTIFNVSKEDMGKYKCIAKNPRGETDGSIRLYGKCHRERIYLIPVVRSWANSYCR